MIQKGIVFKNNPPFWLWMSTINNTFIGHAEDLSIAIPMYNLLQYSGSCFLTSRSLQIYYRDEVDNVNDDDASDGKSFKYKTKITAKKEARPAQWRNDGDVD